MPLIDTVQQGLTLCSVPRSINQNHARICDNIKTIRWKLDAVKVLVRGVYIEVVDKVAYAERRNFLLRLKNCYTEDKKY